MPQKILNEDWSEYEARKKNVSDIPYFSCTESWEVDFLVHIIRKNYPEYAESLIRAAIGSCCRNTFQSRERAPFINSVILRLTSQ
jgi:hypothetical protein